MAGKGELFDLSGKVAVVTGSSRGIGRAIAERMAEHGAKVVISSRKQAACEETAAAINARCPGRAIAIAANIASKEQLQQLVGRTREAFGGIDILVCNAASSAHIGPLSTLTDEAFRRTMDVNVLSQNWLVQMVVPDMRERRDGAVVLVSSIAGLRGTDVIGAYAISKAADMQLVRSLAHELAPHNIRVNGIAPGLVETSFAGALWDTPWREAEAGEILLGRPGQPDDVAGAAIYLASRAGAWTTGQTLVVDGGAMC